MENARAIVYAILIAMAVYCGVIRLCNFWSYTKEQLNELFPARRHYTFFCFSLLFLLPVILFPNNEATDFLLKSFWMVFIPSIASVLFRRFFFKRKVRKKVYFLFMVYFCVSFFLVLFLLAVFDVKIYSYRVGIHVLRFIVVALNLFCIYKMIRVIIRIYRRVFLHPKDYYSSEEQFPTAFAKILIWCPFIPIVFSWMLFLSDSPVMELCLGVVVCVMISLLTLNIITPKYRLESAIVLESEDNAYKLNYGSNHISTKNDDTDNQENGLDELAQNDDVSSHKILDEKELVKAASEGLIKEESNKESEILKSRVKTKESNIKKSQVQLSEIDDLIEKGKLYLNSNLTRYALSRELGINEKYLYEVIRTKYDSFYSYINAFRLAYAEAYKKENPEATNEDIAINSGFGSVRTYYRVRSSIQ